MRSNESCKLSEHLISEAAWPIRSHLSFMPCEGLCLSDQLDCRGRGHGMIANKCRFHMFSLSYPLSSSLLPHIPQYPSDLLNLSTIDIDMFCQRFPTLRLDTERF